MVYDLVFDYPVLINSPALVSSRTSIQVAGAHIVSMILEMEHGGGAGYKIVKPDKARAIM